MIVKSRRDSPSISRSIVISRFAQPDVVLVVAKSLYSVPHSS
jgi:hypothetical protein